MAVRLGKTGTFACIGLCCLLSGNLAAKSIEQAVATAFNTNPRLKQVYHSYRASEQVHESALGRWYPTVDLQARAGVGEQDSLQSRAGTQDESIEPTQVNLTLRQILFDGFFTSEESERTEQEMMSEFHTLEASAENIALQVVNAYMEVLRQQQLRQLAEKNLQSHKDIYAQIKLRTDSGLGSASELSQAAGRLARANANLISAGNNFEDAVSTYITRVGEAPDGLVLPVADQQLMPASREALLADALAAHPTIQAAQADVAASNAQYESSRSRYSPTLSLELSGSQVDDSSQPVNVLDEEVKAELVLTYNLFRGGSDKALVRENAYRIAEAKDILLSAQRDVVEGARRSWQALVSLGEQLEFLKIHVEQSYLTQQAYKKQFDLGRRTLLDLLDTENELFEARRNYVNAETDHTIAKYRVMNARGQLLNGLRIDPQEYWRGE